MKIWHVGASSSPNEVNGVNYAIWAVARAQSRLGHEVSLIVEHEPDEAARQAADSHNLKLLRVPVSLLRYKSAAINRLLDDAPPDLAHFHSVFVPQQAFLARRLERSGVAQIITPHGGTSPYILFRDFLKKSLYKLLVETARFGRAAAVTVVLPKEETEIRAFVPGYTGFVRFVPNPVDDALFSVKRSRVSHARKKIVYLGRFDVQHKGIDILSQIASELPEVSFHLYGAADEKNAAQMETLKRTRPPNMHFHPPVYGAEKIQVLKSASLYIQTSRWEVFGISIAEAMAIGLPCAVSESLNFAELFKSEKLGIVLPARPKEAAAEILKALSEPQILSVYSARAKDFALRNFKTEMVAAKYLDCYQEVLEQQISPYKFRRLARNRGAGNVGFEQRL